LLKNLKKSFIYLSLLPAILLVLFIRKPRRRLRFYINYYILNIIFIKNYYLFPLVKKTLNNLKKNILFYQN
ncbi:uncharacterized protein BO80DRAFT_362600, partial [Aspergillus ibericus CBS 121593]